MSFSLPIRERTITVGVAPRDPAVIVFGIQELVDRIVRHALPPTLRPYRAWRSSNDPDARFTRGLSRVSQSFHEAVADVCCRSLDSSDLYDSVRQDGGLGSMNRHRHKVRELTIDRQIERGNLVQQLLDSIDFDDSIFPGLKSLTLKLTREVNAATLRFIRGVCNANLQQFTVLFALEFQVLVECLEFKRLMSTFSQAQNFSVHTLISTVGKLEHVKILSIADIPIPSTVFAALRYLPNLTHLELLSVYYHYIPVRQPPPPASLTGTTAPPPPRPVQDGFLRLKTLNLQTDLHSLRILCNTTMLASLQSLELFVRGLSRPMFQYMAWLLRPTNLIACSIVRDFDMRENAIYFPAANFPALASFCEQTPRLEILYLRHGVNNHFGLDTSTWGPAMLSPCAHFLGDIMPLLPEAQHVGLWRGQQLVEMCNRCRASLGPGQRYTTGNEASHHFNARAEKIRFGEVTDDV